MKTLWSIAGIVLAALAVSAPASAADLFEVPAECNVYVTVQLRSCEVQHYYTCSRWDAGQQESVTFNQEGLAFVSRIDSETQWLESYSFGSRRQEVLDHATDPASLTELLETGIDTFDFQTDSVQTGATRYTGFDRMTGKSLTIDGVTLDQTEYDITAYGENGDVLWASKGLEFINRDWRRFLPGTSVTTANGDEFSSDESPVEFAFPGEPGFLTVNPKYGCSAILSSAPAQLETKEMPHDHL